MNNLHQISDIQVAENNQIQKIEAQANAAVIKSIIYEKSTIVQNDFVAPDISTASKLGCTGKKYLLTFIVLWNTCPKKVFKIIV